MPVSSGVKRILARNRLRWINKAVQRRSRQFRGRMRKLTMGTNISKVLYPYKQYCDGALLTQQVVTSSNLVTNTYAWQFQLNMIPQYVTFTSLYDQYRIDLVEVTFRPRSMVTTALSTAQGPGSYFNNILIAVDHDDAVAPANYNALREYGNAFEKQLAIPNPFKMTFKPAVASLVYNGVVPATGERFSPWIDCGNPDVPHYGIKCALPITSIAGLITVDITVRYLLEFKQVR